MLSTEHEHTGLNRRTGLAVLYKHAPNLERNAGCRFQEAGCKLQATGLQHTEAVEYLDPES